MTADALDHVRIGTGAFSVTYKRIRIAAQSYASKHRRRSTLNWEDLTQETIVRVLSGRQSWDGPMQDLVRKESVVRIGNQNVGSTQLIFTSLATAGRTLSLPAKQNCLMARVSLALLALSEQERQTIRMEFWEDMSQREIGERIGYHQTRVSQFHLSAIRKLREAVGVVISVGAESRQEGRDGS